MTDSELTVAILREIRDDVRTTRDELARVESRLGDRIDRVDARLEIVEHAVKDLAGQHLMLTRFVKNVAERHGGAIEDLDERVTRLESDDQ